MTFHIPQSPSIAVITRQERIRVRYPQANSVLESIEKSTRPLPFGCKISRILNNYHFLEPSHVRSFFTTYLARRFGREPDIDEVNKHVFSTINLIPPNIDKDHYRTDRGFENIYRILSTDMSANEEARVPTLNFVVGPTGAGKTIFSKSLFTVCLKRFWSSETIPSRVEYSKFEHKTTNNWINSEEFFAYIRRCLFRDLVLYFLFSNRLTADERWRLVSTSRIAEAHTVLTKLHAATKDIVLDGEEQTLGDGIAERILRIWQELADHHRDALFFELVEALKPRFLISFDGFDCVRIEDFLFADKTPLPIKYLMQLLKSMHEKTATNRIFSRHIEAHYLVYLRDTSFERLRMELFRGVGRKVEYPVYWIVPPKYEMLVENVAKYLSGLSDLKRNMAEVFTEDIFQAFDSYIFRSSALNAATHMNFVFGSNARRMYQHIRQTLIAALHRAVQSEEFDFARLTSGVDPKSIWFELVNKHSARHLPQYIILEDLFLHDTRQLIPKLQVDPSVISRLLRNGNLIGAIESTDDRDETNGIFGCLLNYFFQTHVVHERNRRPGLLLLVRILQFLLAQKHRSNSGEVTSFLKSLGYVVTQTSVEYCLYVLIRTELVKWDAAAGAQKITDVPLYITTRGEIAASRLLSSVTYLSESMLSSIHDDEAASDLFKPRNHDNAVWVADCVYNASIGLEIIRTIEEVEQINRSKVANDFDKFRLTSRLKADLFREARTIIRSVSRTREAWKSNYNELVTLRDRWPNLTILGEQHEAL